MAQTRYTDAALPVQAPAIAALFETTFTASEGRQEGRLIGGLAGGLLTTTPKAELHCHIALDGDRLAGAIIWTRLRYATSPLVLWLLSPVAILPPYQGQGIGQGLIRHGLETIRQTGAAGAATYGDPQFYGKLGFAPAQVATLAPPFPLSQPAGWLVQSFLAQALPALPGPSTCAPSLSDPAFW